MVTCPSQTRFMTKHDGIFCTITKPHLLGGDGPVTARLATKSNDAAWTTHLAGIAAYFSSWDDKMQFIGDVPYQLLQGFTRQQDFWLNCADLSNIFAKVEYFANLEWLSLLLCTLTEKTHVCQVSWQAWLQYVPVIVPSLKLWHATYGGQVLAFQGYVMEKWITRSTCVFAVGDI